MKGESKEERFKRVAEKRVQVVIESLRKLSQCTNKRMYSWDDAQTKKIWKAIYAELEKAKASFKNIESEEFKL